MAKKAPILEGRDLIALFLDDNEEAFCTYQTIVDNHVAVCFNKIATVD